MIVPSTFNKNASSGWNQMREIIIYVIQYKIQMQILISYLLKKMSSAKSSSAVGSMYKSVLELWDKWLFT